eukprot:TRINITY_DN22033_c0_g1_i1.p1 TRINITY_DN22033_c0_g1~~TRINITY_DN22033_c0_g1_i1.p1  ORF type:complete len:498 (+),score=52.69 TRINITY_DN22033_c0_g1_i1:252-1745(+)
MCSAKMRYWLMQRSIRKVEQTTRLDVELRSVLPVVEAVRGVAMLLGKGATSSPWSSNVLSGLAFPGDYYQFGVAAGFTLSLYREAFPEVRFWGFDSFGGLPDDGGDDLRRDNWWVGKFKSSDNPEAFAKMLADKHGGSEKTGFVVGYFNETLKPELRALRGMRPAVFVDIDVDLYSSAIHVLDFLFKNGLVRVGTVFHYDDWTSCYCTSQCRGYGEPHPERRQLAELCEPRAHVEAALKYGVRFLCVSGACRRASSAACDVHHHHTAIFVVTSIEGACVGGGGHCRDRLVSASHGIEISEDELVKWARKSRECQVGLHHRLMEPVKAGCFDSTFSYCGCCAADFGPKGNPVCWEHYHGSYEQCCRKEDVSGEAARGAVQTELMDDSSADLGFNKHEASDLVLDDPSAKRGFKEDDVADDVSLLPGDLLCWTDALGGYARFKALRDICCANTSNIVVVGCWNDELTYERCCTRAGGAYGVRNGAATEVVLAEASNREE